MQFFQNFTFFALHGVFLHQISPFLFLPLGKKPKGIAMSMSVRPSVRGHFTFFRVQGAFLHQISPFLVCRLVIKLFCGSFNDFGVFRFLGPKTVALWKFYRFWRNPTFGAKTRKCVPKIYHFLNFHIFSNAGCISSQNIVIFGLQAFIKLLSGSFIRI